MEYFSRHLAIRTKDNDFNFHAKCGRLQITRLAFGGDLILFSRGDVHSVGILMNALQEFADCSGLQVNRSKSTFFTVGVGGDNLEVIKQIVGFPLGE